MTASYAFAMTFSDGALDVLVRCEDMIRDARHWFERGDWAQELGLEPGTDAARRFYDEQAVALANMERSLYYCVFRLIRLAGPAGSMELYADGESSIFWRLPNGFHGGLNYHANHHGEHRLLTGSWSLNT